MQKETKSKIIKYPSQTLRKKSQEIKEITQEVQDLSQEMARIMAENQGIGLAAPQVGELKRIIVIGMETGPEVFINPKIVKIDKEAEIEKEGCLSFSGFFLKIKRSKGLEVEFLNAKGEKKRIKAEGLIARVFQHEIDHLNGILFIDRVSFWQRFKIKRRLKSKPQTCNNLY